MASSEDSIWESLEKPKYGVLARNLSAKENIIHEHFEHYLENQVQRSDTGRPFSSDADLDLDPHYDGEDEIFEDFDQEIAAYNGEVEYFNTNKRMSREFSLSQYDLHIRHYQGQGHIDGDLENGFHGSGDRSPLEYIEDDEEFVDEAYEDVTHNAFDNKLYFEGQSHHGNDNGSGHVICDCEDCISHTEAMTCHCDSCVQMKDGHENQSGFSHHGNHSNLNDHVDQSMESCQCAECLSRLNDPEYSCNCSDCRQGNTDLCNNVSKSACQCPGCVQELGQGEGHDKGQGQIDVKGHRFPPQGSSQEYENFEVKNFHNESNPHPDLDLQLDTSFDSDTERSFRSNRSRGSNSSSTSKTKGRNSSASNKSKGSYSGRNSVDLLSDRLDNVLIDDNDDLSGKPTIGSSQTDLISSTRGSNSNSVHRDRGNNPESVHQNRGNNYESVQTRRGNNSTSAFIPKGNNLSRTRDQYSKRPSPNSAQISRGHSSEHGFSDRGHNSKGALSERGHNFNGAYIEKDGNGKALRSQTNNSVSHQTRGHNSDNGFHDRGNYSDGIFRDRGSNSSDTSFDNISLSNSESSHPLPDRHNHSPVHVDITRLLEQQLQKTETDLKKKTSDYETEIKELRRENDKQNKLIQQNLSLTPDAKIEATMQHEISRLTSENLDLRETIDKQAEQIRKLKKMVKVYAKRMKDGEAAEIQAELEHEETKSVENVAQIKHRERNYMGMLEYKKEDENAIIKILILDLKPKLASSYLPGLPSYLLFMCVRHTDYINDDEKVRSFLTNTINGIKKVVKKHHDDLDRVTLWLANTCRFLHTLKQYSGEKPFQTENTARQNEHCLRNFDLAEYRQVFSDLAVWIYQTLIKLLEATIQPSIVSAVLEHEAIAGLTGSKPSGLRGRSSSRADDTPEHSLDGLMKSMNQFVQILNRHAVDPELIKQIFRQLYYFLGASALNNLLLRKDMCNWSKGMQIRYNLSYLEQWLRDSKLQESGAGSTLDPIIQASQLLQARKTDADVDSVCDMCSKLAVPQIVKILNLYTPVDEFEERVPITFIRKIQQKLKERANPESSLLMDLKFSYSVTFPFNPSKIALEGIEVPEQLNLGHMVTRL